MLSIITCIASFFIKLNKLRLNSKENVLTILFYTIPMRLILSIIKNNSALIASAGIKPNLILF